MKRTRPPGVPAEAVWDRKEREWLQVAVDGRGRRAGPALAWDADGHLLGESRYRRGLLHGMNKRYHPDGTLDSIGEWIDGRIYDTVFFRSARYTGEFPDDVAPNVEMVCFHSRNGRTNCAASYRDGSGKEVMSDGREVPTRPSSVPSLARFVDERGGLWATGELTRETSQPVGMWTWWSLEGELLYQEVLDRRGRRKQITRYKLFYPGWY